MREYCSNFPINRQFCLAARAIHFERIYELFRHTPILRQFWPVANTTQIRPDTAPYRFHILHDGNDLAKEPPSLSSAYSASFHVASFVRTS
jgi:hypothetical protein